MRPLLLAVALLSAAACRHPPPGNTTPAHPSQSRTPAQPVVVRDTALEQRAGRLELKTLEQEAQIEELQDRLDDARREVVRAMAKLQSLATRAEAASGMAEAEIALEALRSANASGGGSSPASPELAQGTQLLQLATAEFDKQNYAGARRPRGRDASRASAGHRARAKYPSPCLSICKRRGGPTCGRDRAPTSACRTRWMPVRH